MIDKDEVETGDFVSYEVFGRQEYFEVTGVASAGIYIRSVEHMKLDGEGHAYHSWKRTKGFTLIKRKDWKVLKKGLIVP